MRYAIAADGESVAPHFGRCERYEMLDIEGDQIVGREQVATPDHEPGVVPAFLKEHGAQVVVCGGAGPRAIDLLAQLGIGMFMGVSGSLDEVIGAILRSELVGGDSSCEH